MARLQSSPDTPSWPPSASWYSPSFTAAMEEKMSGAPLPQAISVTVHRITAGTGTGSHLRSVRMDERQQMQCLKQATTSSKPGRQVEVLRHLGEDRREVVLRCRGQHAEQQPHDKEAQHLENGSGTCPRCQ